MSDPEPSFKPNAKALALEMYKEMAKWLVELAKPLITTVSFALSILIAGQMAVFGAFLITDLTVKRYQLFLWILLGAVIGLCTAGLYLGRRLKWREMDSAKRAHLQLLAAEQRAERAEANATSKLLEFEKRALSAETIAALDSLTGLFNLREFERRILYETREAFGNKHTLSMILMDIDGFGDANQKYGYPAGDSILKQFASGLIEGSRRKDPFFRYRSGDEFAVLALNQGQAGSRAFAERIRRETETSEFEIWDITKKHHFVKITISAGVAEILFPSNTPINFDEVVRVLESQAQAALSRAKLHKNRVIAFDSYGVVVN